jgi:putative ABC transport system substrate-binding protein
MNEKIFSFMLCASLLVLSSSAEAQQAGKIPRIGFLGNSTAELEANLIEPFRAGLRELGYVEGQNIAIEYWYAEGKVDRAPELAAELVRLKVDVIVVAGGPAWVRAVKNATKTIPIVMIGPGIDPVEAGVVESLARPGGNVTGITLLIQELNSKRLELFKEAVPKLASVALLYNPANLFAARELKEDLPATARALKLTIQPWEVRDADGFERVFDALSKKRPDGLYALSSGALMFANVKRIAGFALKSRLPSMFFNRQAVDAGSCTTGRTKRKGTGALPPT